MRLDHSMNTKLLCVQISAFYCIKVYLARPFYDFLQKVQRERRALCSFSYFTEMLMAIINDVSFEGSKGPNPGKAISTWVKFRFTKLRL